MKISKNTLKRIIKEEIQQIAKQQPVLELFGKMALEKVDSFEAMIRLMYKNKDLFIKLFDKGHGMNALGDRANGNAMYKRIINNPTEFKTYAARDGKDSMDALINYGERTTVAKHMSTLVAYAYAFAHYIKDQKTERTGKPFTNYDHTYDLGN